MSEDTDRTPPISVSRSRDILANHLPNAIVAFVFAITGPIAIMFGAAAKTGLSHDELASWVFGAFFVNGVISLVACIAYRQPLVFLWSIPGIILIGSAVQHLTFAEVVGAYTITGGLLVAIGVSGQLSRITDLIPMPIVMAMVAGILLKFGLDWIAALSSATSIAIPMTVAFFVFSAFAVVRRIIPPVVASLFVGLLSIFLLSETGDIPTPDLTIGSPTIFVPAYSIRAAAELVVPLLITVVLAQNGQGIAILQVAGHRPPVNAITTICGLSSIVTAITGTVSTCLTGPVSGILTASGRAENQFVGAIVVAFLCMAFGLIAPTVTALMLSIPKAFIATLGGLALLSVLQGSFSAAFSGRFPKSALIAFMVTVSDLSIANIGAPFWGLVAGLVATWSLERTDYA